MVIVRRSCRLLNRQSAIQNQILGTHYDIVSKSEKPKKSTIKTRCIIGPMGDIIYTKDIKSIKEWMNSEDKPLANPKTQVELVFSTTLSDGTFINMFMTKESRYDMWYLFNPIASLIRNNPLLKCDIQEAQKIIRFHNWINEIGCKECFYQECSGDCYKLDFELLNTVNGAVMIIRVDEDGEELDIDEFFMKEIFFNARITDTMIRNNCL